MRAFAFQPRGMCLWISLVAISPVQIPGDDVGAMKRDEPSNSGRGV